MSARVSMIGSELGDKERPGGTRTIAFFSEQTTPHDDRGGGKRGRRCFIARGNPAGVLVGHLEGITFLDSRGDGRYFISNGKDQTIKLWDIRKIASNAPCDLALRNYEWDYRWMDYPPQAKDLKHPGLRCATILFLSNMMAVLRTRH
ncbi:hypothetical protein GH714_023531 [Hevea brasiliensis]|uniref:Uncharacterized protein n=1 Tax=Hevea brasiliensis TaxID=3981 RepID=A0A6A6LW00_HEVBR|nr:hypothetical protein GH714_023531 [Hevea brasiliensis]